MSIPEYVTKKIYLNRSKDENYDLFDKLNKENPGFMTEKELEDFMWMGTEVAFTARIYRDGRTVIEASEDRYI